MVTKKNLKKIEEYLYEIPKSFRQDMRVPARVYSDQKMLDEIMKERSLEQLVNVATLPGIIKWSLAMPDIHEGYGFPIGGVAATELPKGVISPGGIGYDRNCGVRVLTSQVSYQEIKPYLKNLVDQFFRDVPSGVGRGGELKVSFSELDQVLSQGVTWAQKKGYATKEDQDHTEEQGHIKQADPACVSDKAKQRGKDQIGTLGSGNHFLEIQRIEEIFNPKVAEIFGLKKDQITIMIHCGSRGLGHQVCTDYVRIMMNVLDKYKITLPDRELVCVPFDSEEGQKYFAAMSASANYAWANRQYIQYLVKNSWSRVLSGKFKNLSLKLLYDVAHNIGKVEEHSLDGKIYSLCLHRKGATRAFAPGRKEVPEDFREIGQPVIIPGTMGTASYVLIGTKKAMETTFGSVCHGAGRTMSRAKAKRTVWGAELRKKLEAQGIVIRCESSAGLAEEAPIAYKNVDRVVDIVCQAGLALKVARLQPLGVIKGG